jgi:hypothetical protein
MTPQDLGDSRVVDFEAFARRITADRVLPHNLDAERSILGAILLHDDALPIAAATISPGDFFRDAHIRIFLAMMTLQARGTAIDLVTLHHALTESGHLDAVGGPAYLAALVDGVPRSTNVDAYAHIVKDLALRRRLVHAATKALAAAYERDADIEAIRATALQDFTLLVEPTRATPLPVLQTARELSARPDPATSDQLLGPLIIRGQRHLIGGHTGRGKTSLILGLLKAMLTRTPYLGFEPHTQTPRILVIDAEQGIRTIKRRLRETDLHDRDDLVYLCVPGGITLDTSAAERAALDAYLRDGQFDVVVASPLYKLHNGDSNEERAAVDLMKLFDRWRDLYGFASIFEMHCRKPPPVGAHLTMHDFFGSSAYLRGAEIVIGIDRLRPGASRLYFFKDRDGDLPCGEPWNLTFDRETGFARDLTTKQTKPTVLAKVTACLRHAAHPLAADDIRAVVQCSDRALREALKELGAIPTPTGDRNLKHYSLPPTLLDDIDDPYMETE